MAEAYGIDPNSNHFLWLHAGIADAVAKAAEDAEAAETEDVYSRVRRDWVEFLSDYYGDWTSVEEYTAWAEKDGPDAADAKVHNTAWAEKDGPDAADAKGHKHNEEARRHNRKQPERCARQTQSPSPAAAETQAAREHLKRKFLQQNKNVGMQEPTVVPFERGLPLPPRPYLGFDLEARPMRAPGDQTNPHLPNPDAADWQAIEANLRRSFPDAFEVQIWRVHRAASEAMYQTELKRVGNERLLWHSTSDTDPLKLVFSDHPFDSTYAVGGSYGAGLYFSEHAVYGGAILPCRNSALDVDDGLRGKMPEVGDDVMLTSDSKASYTILELDGTTAVLQKLRWNARKHEKKLEKPFPHDLSDGGWRFADRRYAIVAAVALGETKDYGRETDEDLERAPDGYHSVTGTENAFHIQQTLNRINWYPEWKPEFRPLVEHGREFGRQYVVFHETQAVPRFIVRYRSRRKRS